MTVIEKVASRMCFWLNTDMVKILMYSFVGIMFLPGCASLRKKQEPINAPSGKRLAGRVYKIDHVSRFVLIRRYGSWHVGEGDVVESRGEGRTANLFPSGERLGEHIAADIRSGEVEEGDMVYIRKGMILKKPKIPSDAVKLSSFDH